VGYYLRRKIHWVLIGRASLEVCFPTGNITSRRKVTSFYILLEPGDG